MSRENVVLFSKAIGSDPDIGRLVGEAEPTVEAWLKIAAEAGFEFTGDELVSVVGETLGHAVTRDDAVRAYLRAQDELGAEPLSQKALDGVVGGARRTRMIIP